MRRGLVFAEHETVGETREAFAERLGVGLTSLKRYETEGTLPTNKAVLSVLDALAEKYGVTPQPQT